MSSLASQSTLLYFWAKVKIFNSYSYLIYWDYFYFVLTSKGIIKKADPNLNLTPIWPEKNTIELTLFNLITVSVVACELSILPSNIWFFSVLDTSFPNTVDGTINKHYMNRANEVKIRDNYDNSFTLHRPQLLCTILYFHPSYLLICILWTYWFKFLCRFKLPLYRSFKVLFWPL